MGMVVPKTSPVLLFVAQVQNDMRHLINLRHQIVDTLMHSTLLTKHDPGTPLPTIADVAHHAFEAIDGDESGTLPARHSASRKFTP